MIDLLKLDLGRLPLLKRQPGSALLGMAFDGSRLEFAELRRTNGSVDILRSGAVSLSLNLLKDDPLLVGREIRKHLDAAGVRERWCTVSVPLTWVLTHSLQLPELSGEDLEAFLEIEAERGFPYNPESLILSHSQCTTPAGEPHVTMVAIPRDHVTRLEAALKAAQLRPVRFSLGIVALQPHDTDTSSWGIALIPGDNSVGLQVGGQGGVAVLRAMESAYELEGGEQRIQGDHIARELRITAGQLPADVREVLHAVRIFGRSDAATELAEQLEPRAKSLGMTVERARDYAPEEFGVRVPAGTPVSSALSIALRYLAGYRTGFEFLPPKISAWKQFADRYASRKLAAAGVAVGAVVLLIALALLVQQWQLMRWQSKWSAIEPRVTELEAMQQQIKQFRPWFSRSARSLAILRQLTEAFPEDGAVAAKTLAFRAPATITCTGTARDNQALLKALDHLRTARQVSDVQVVQMRGKSPVQFSFNFQWHDQVTP